MGSISRQSGPKTGRPGRTYACIRRGNPRQRKRRSTRPHFSREPVYIGGGGLAVRDGARARYKWMTARTAGTRGKRGNALRGRWMSNSGKYGVRTPKMRAERISHLSFHARHLRVAIGDIGIYKKKKTHKKHLPAPDDCSAANRRATLLSALLFCVIYERLPIRQYSNLLRFRWVPIRGLTNFA